MNSKRIMTNLIHLNVSLLLAMSTISRIIRIDVIQ